MAIPDQLPEPAKTALAAFVAASRQVFADDLVSVTLFGSAAEGRLRPTSDVNVIIVLSRCDPARLAAIGDAYRLAHAAVRLSAMFILAGEIADAAEAFAVKFSDIAARHEVLYGSDPFIGLRTSREASLHRLRQVTTNLSLRLRERYALASAYPERLLQAAADAVGPLRASAALLLSLESGTALSPREALRQVAAESESSEALATMVGVREQGRGTTADPAAALRAALELTEKLRTRAERIA